MAESGIQLLKLSKNSYSEDQSLESETKKLNEIEKNEVNSNDINPDLKQNVINNWKTDFYPFSDVNWDISNESLLL